VSPAVHVLVEGALDHRPHCALQEFNFTHEASSRRVVARPQQCLLSRTWRARALKATLIEHGTACSDTLLPRRTTAACQPLCLFGERDARVHVLASLQRAYASACVPVSRCAPDATRGPHQMPGAGKRLRKHGQRSQVTHISASTLSLNVLSHDSFATDVSFCDIR
jgi:hypothetical protein